ncbi:MAG TPA: integrase [Prolixibacteraceae bacterium]|nr:integrase [Prolixibacteraceae bacterium]
MAIKVSLRMKPISGKRQTLYLDFYPAIIDPKTGKITRREFLNTYVFSDTEIEEQKYDDINGKEQKRFIPVLDKKGNPKKAKLDPTEKQHNEVTLQRAEQIRQKKESEINKPEIYSGYEKQQLKIKQQGEKNFIEYFKKLADKRIDSNRSNWLSAYQYLEAFTNGKLKFEDLNETLCNDFKDYLLSAKSKRSDKTTLSQNTAGSYFLKFKAALKQAYKDKYLQYDLNNSIDPIKVSETRRSFLTIEEMNSLVKTECKNSVLKNAAIFSAMTGLRFSDISKLVWSELEYIEGNGYFIQFRQQKTDDEEMMPISEQAYSLLGERKAPTDKVFDGLNYSAYSNKDLAKWIGAAGITKDITFHCFRHTYATLQLSNGTDIYTVSKMLGHRDLKTTQIYAKIISQTKRDAADRIKLDF